MSPVASATGRKCPGETSPRSGCRQRSSASAPMMRPRVRVELGLVVDLEGFLREGAEQMLLDGHATSHGGVHVLAVEVEAIPAPLLRVVERAVGTAREIIGLHGVARGSSRCRCSPGSASTGRGSGWARSGRRGSCAPRQPHGPRRPGVVMSTANSSPPTRAATSVSRRQETRRRARPRIRPSAAAWPRWSLMPLKSSRSIHSTATPWR